MHKGRGLRRSEPQLGHPDLGHLAGCTQAPNRQRRISPRYQHDLGGRREMIQQESDLVVAAAFGDYVIVVKHENDRCPEFG